MSRTLVRRARADEVVARNVLTAPVWGHAFTLAQYLERERVLREHPFARAGFDTWVLADEDDDAMLFASLETLRQPLVLPDGGRGHGYGVASVFTEPAFRGRGHATELLTGVLRTLADEDPLARASVLFSDVGAPIYQRCGYVAFRGDDVVISASPSAFLGEPIDRDHVPTARVRPGLLTFVNSPDRLDWLLTRQTLHAGFLQRREPPAVGARLGESYVIWFANFRKSTLDILAFDADDAAAPTLLATARHVAHQFGLAHVVAWSSEGIPAAALHSFGAGATRRPRDGGLVMIAPMGSSSGATLPLRESIAPVSQGAWC